MLGVSAGIAAYKAVEICRQLVDDGAHVVPVLSENALRFVGEVTFSALASEPARTSLWNDRSPIPHTELGQNADLIVVAPATADLIARYVHGMADDLLTCTLLATRAPVIICPAMHTEMWEHPSVQHNLEILTARGVHVVPPQAGRLAGGDTGIGRLAEPQTVVAEVRRVLGRDGGPEHSSPARSTECSDMTGWRVLISAGGTREPIDPVRYLTNRSSGRQGHALAEAAARRGAEVELVTSSALRLSTDVATTIDTIEVETADDMYRAMTARAPKADVVIMAAAVSDFRPRAAAERKLHRDEGLPDIVLEPTPDILKSLVAERRPGQVIVGFAAETDDALGRGRAKLARKGVDVLVINDVSAPGVGFDHETNAVVILDVDGRSEEVPLSTKSTVAQAVLDTVLRRLGPGQNARREPQRP